MAGKTRPSLRAKTLQNVASSNLSSADKKCIESVFEKFEALSKADVVEMPDGGIGNLSDGYHTFNELYHHRAVLFSVICNSMPDKAWKSKLHDTGDMFDGMFIVGIETPEGQATYHYDIEPYWDMFKVKELEKAPKWDGHTPDDAINRIEKLSADVVKVKHGEWYLHPDGSGTCSNCNRTQKSVWDMDNQQNYCGNCGAKMDGKENNHDVQK